MADKKSTLKKNGGPEDGTGQTLYTTTGRGAYDVAAIAISKLGPPAILGIVALVAVYFFIEQQNQARRDIASERQAATEHASEALIEAQNSLSSTYHRIADLSGQQIENIERVLALEEEVTADLETERERLRELEDSVEIKQKEVDQQAFELAEARKASEQQRLALELSQRKTEANETRLALLEEELERKLEEVKRADKRAADLATLVAESRAEIAELQAGAGAEVSTPPDADRSRDQLARKTIDALQNYAQAPGPGTSKALTILVGQERQNVEKILLEHDLGFETWIIGSNPFDEETIYVGVRRTDRSGQFLRWPLILFGAENRIVEVESQIEATALFRLSDPLQWFGQAVGVYTRFGGEEEIEAAPIHFFNASNDSWSIISWLGSEIPDMELKPLRGSDVKLDVLSLTEFHRQHPDSFQSLIFSDQDIAASWEMERRAARFDIRQLDLIGIEKEFPDLSTALGQIIKMAIERKTEELTRHIGVGTNLDDMGILAALALRPDFYVIGAFDFENTATQMQAQTAQQIVPVEELDEPSGGPARLLEETATADGALGERPPEGRVIEILVIYGGAHALDGGGEAVLQFSQARQGEPWQLSSLQLAEE